MIGVLSGGWKRCLVKRKGGGVEEVESAEVIYSLIKSRIMMFGNSRMKFHGDGKTGYERSSLYQEVIS